MKPRNALSFLVWFLIVAPVGTDRVFDLAGAPGWFTVIMQVLVVASLLLTYVPMIVARQRTDDRDHSSPLATDWRDRI